MKKKDYKIKDPKGRDSSSHDSPPWIFQQGKLFDELGVQKLWDQKKLINKLNHINFTDGHIFILFNNAVTGEQILVKAYPQPCIKDELICQLDIQTNISDLEKCNPTYLMIEDGHTTILATTEFISKINSSIKVTIPEKCYSITKRRTKRYRCADITCKVIQGDFNTPGMLIDFTPGGLGIKLTGNRNIKGFDEKKSFLINLTRSGVKLFSGLCQCIRNDMDLPDGRIVFVPLNSQMALFPKREMRNPPKHIVPSFSMSFKHPFFKETVERDIFDISPAGFSLRDKIDEESLLPGMIISNIMIDYAGTLKINCSAQVVYRQEDPENNLVHCGLAIVDIDVHSYSKLNHILSSYRKNNAHVFSEVDMDTLGELFFATGFIYGEKDDYSPSHRKAFKATYQKLYHDNTDIARHFAYEKNGKIYGHMALVHAYQPSWIIHHFAARKIGNRLPGAAVLKQITQYIGAYNRFPSAKMDYLLTGYQSDNKVADRVFGSFSRQLNDPKKSSLDIFSYFLFKKSPSAEKLPPEWKLREAIISDLVKLKEFYEISSGGLLLSALGLEIPADSLKKSFIKAGFKRDYCTYCLCYKEQQVAFFIVNQSDLGPNLSDLLNSIKIIVLEPEILPWAKLSSAVNDLSGFFAGENIPLLTFPASYLSSQNIAPEKQYTVWILQLRPAVESQQGVGDQLMKQLDIRYNELALIKEIGEAASSILDPQKLLNFITDSLQKRLQFNRGMIMLTNPEKTKLVYTTGYGYTSAEETLLAEMDFNLTDPQSKGVFYSAYRDQKPFLVSNTADIENKLFEKSANFIKELGIKAFICVPIIYEGKTEGILAVDGTKLKNLLTQSDLNLLMGIAPQIGISLNNALAHKKLKESEERFRNLSDNSPDIIYQLNKYGIFTYTNPAWEDILGHNISNVLGKNFIAFIHEDDHEKCSKVLGKIITDKATIRDQIFIMLNNKGLPHYITFTGAPDLDAEKNVIGIVGTLKDITKMRSMETQLLQASKMEAIGTLTGGIAHDFNNIIQAIRGYNHLMLAEKRGNQTETLYLNSIEELTQRSVELVRQLLLFSRKVEPLTKVININDEIKSMHNLLVKSIPKMIDIETNLFEDIFPINADSAQIGQVIMNLIINARDAISDSGKITIKTNNLVLQNNKTISGLNIPEGNYIELTVSDTGQGMDRKVMQHIFEPFFTTKEVGKGTGLGLAVVYGVIQSHNGFIYCESELDKGTTFNIIFPAITSANPQKAIKQLQQPKQSPTGTETILLVDDEKSILDIGRDTLSFYGYTILTAENGEQAIEIYQTQQEKIQLIILDLIMPGKGGKKCLNDLVAINPRVKVLMTSGYSSSRQVEELINAGASGFIDKPYHSEDLLASIRKIIDSDPL